MTRVDGASFNIELNEHVTKWLTPRKKGKSSVDEKAAAVFLKVLELFEDLGPLEACEDLPRSRLKKMFGNIFEIRVDNFRLGYFWDGNTCVLLHGIKKKQDKWPQKDINVLKQRQREYFSMLVKG